MEMYFKVGDLAKMFNMSARALRLYDKMDLFKPGHIDEQTGYRYYTADQLPLLNTILVFKAIGVKLHQIKHLVDNGISPEELIKVMSERRDFWEKQIVIAKFNIENIDKIMSATSTKLEQAGDNCKPDAYKMSRLVCLENLKVESFLTEVLWL